jgi:hypothetical protein
MDWNYDAPLPVTRTAPNITGMSRASRRPPFTGSRRSFRAGVQAGWLALVLALLCCDSTRLRAQDIDDLYRLTIFPYYHLSDKFTVYAHVAYAYNPDQDYHSFNFASPGIYYSPTDWFQLWEGFINRYTDNNGAAADQLELRPFVGVKLFVPNGWKINLYNFTRYEYRAIQDLDTHDWSSANRIRSRFAAEIPLVSGENAWHPKTWYALVNAEPFYTFDQPGISPLNVSGGFGYVASHHVQVEFTYSAHFERANGGPLEFTENIFRLNIKIGLNREQRPAGPTPSF